MNDPILDAVSAEPDTREPIATPRAMFWAIVGSLASFAVIAAIGVAAVNYFLPVQP